MSTELILLRDWQESQIEFWLPILGWPAYDVSNFGRIRTRWRRQGGGNIYVLSSGFRLRLLTPVRSAHFDAVNHYLGCTLAHKKRRKLMQIHKLVAAAFLPNPKGLKVVNHKNFFKPDCRVDNLEFVSGSRNTLHAIENGVRPQNPLLLSRQKVAEAKVLRETQGISYDALGKRFGVSYSVMRNALTGRTKSYMPTKENHRGCTSIT